MSSPINTDYRTPADIITLSKARRVKGEVDSGAATPAAASGHALQLPEDVVTLSSQLNDSSSPAVHKVRSQPVTTSEKNALLISNTPPGKLSVYG